jgi:hypothetical protein
MRKHSVARIHRYGTRAVLLDDASRPCADIPNGHVRRNVLEAAAGGAPQRTEQARPVVDLRG